MSKASAEELYRLYNEENLSQREIGERYGVGQAAVSNWMSELNVETDRAGKWSEKEKQILKKRYPDEKQELKEKLADRTWNAIKLKAMDMGLARDQEEYRHSDEVKNQLQALSEENSIDPDFDAVDAFSYVLGVIDGDGFHDNSGTIGLEVKDEEFAQKFMENLEAIGLNPNSGERRGKKTVWASSKLLVERLKDIKDSKVKWLKEEGEVWSYLEGQYDSDGNLHPSGSPRICSYDGEEKERIRELLKFVGVESNIQQNNVWITKSCSSTFFEKINPVLDRRRP